MRLTLDVFHVSPQHLADAPGLRNTSAGPVWWVPIKNLRDVPESALGQVILQRFEPLRCLQPRRRASSVDLHVGCDKRSDQPGPHRPLVIGGVTLSSAAGIASAVLRITRCETA